tara:strand:+ start:4180 stop:4392 length:213 start_codon:yes stop_codon:yes gene_type:complete
MQKINIVLTELKTCSLKMSKNKSLFGEIWDFLKVRKAWWLAPIIIMLILVGILIVFGQSSALSPFIYALF